MVDANVSISIIIPCLDIDEYTREAVASVLDNRCADQIEVLLVIDGPLPADGGTLTKQLPPSVRVLATGRRSGSARATNVGLRQARGRYIGRMDADDVSLTGRLDVQLCFMEGNKDVVVCGGGGPIIDGDGGVIGTYPDPGAGEVRPALLRRNPLVHSSLLVRGDVLRALGGYREDMIRMQDYDLLLRLAAVGSIWSFGNEHLVRYRAHDGQTSTKASRFLHTMRVITAGRRRLLRVVGGSAVSQSVDDAAWVVAQALRYGGLRQPGFRSAIRRVPVTS